MAYQPRSISIFGFVKATSIEMNYLQELRTLRLVRRFNVFQLGKYSEGDITNMLSKHYAHGVRVIPPTHPPLCTVILKRN